ncbi:MAG: sigma-54-dependent Fis family transcriptional regulator [Deltaproteobacteria bacterium]|nr:sigma-54-dependent Fis family transcriptional regulator [Deltaproteobacteria bacterium]MBW1952553.1 sigma-54-dependent Fis family transcriptional regulator [Deltaproteobacteria bacterium]MBW1986116.1 sigma-54-dependent Fis family transcriptional regulator [Deltaproteobacteria bacterium]MBW2134198.1 sigma-54-dependent Fis family transcriptional regulator [Deltaproteobacteria bacterium]
MDTILVVDDEKNYLLVMEALLSGAGYEVLTAESATEAQKIVRHNDLDLIITDMKMPRVSGIELMEEIQHLNPDLPVIIMTAFGTVEKAVEAMKKGAFDYITKPFKNEEILVTIAKALELRHLLDENRRLRQDLAQKYRFENIVGNSRAMQEIFALVEKVAQTRVTVLITGESGTGKELIARAIHQRSPRSQRPFISVNCGALTETLLESELFGHEKGAFTHAVALRKGRFELADGGTLFLDEVTEMSPALQVKLLRVLQEMEFERVGGSRTLRVDVRLVAASNRDLKAEVDEGNFREDLFYRLNVVHLEIPPLRQRPEDIPLLVTHFIQKYTQENAQGEVRVDPETMRILTRHSWPGNVRELENVIERAVILRSGDVITPADLPPNLATTRPESEFDIDRLVPLNTPLPEALERIEELMIRRALEHSGQVQVRAAELLGITKSLLQYKLKKYHLNV